MTEIVQESLLDELLKSRYPLTYYLRRQQEFVNVFSTTTQTTRVSTLFESETNVIGKRKPPLPPCYNIPDTINPRASEFNDAQNEIHSDQDDSINHDQNSETDDDATQEYDEKPILKSINEKHSVQ